MTRKEQNNCRHFRAVPSSHTERALMPSAFMVDTPSYSPPQYTVLSRMVLIRQLIVLTIQPVTTSSSADVRTTSVGRRRRLVNPPRLKAAAVTHFVQPDLLRRPHPVETGGQGPETVSAVPLPHLPGVGPPLRRMTAGGWPPPVRPPAFSFQSQNRSRLTRVCGARPALQGGVSNPSSSSPCRKLPWRGDHEYEKGFHA